MRWRRLLVVMLILASALPGVALAQDDDAELAAIEERIWQDDRVLERQRIWVVSTGRAADRLRVDVISPRSDARAFMRERYGPRITVDVVAKRRFRRVRTSWQRYKVLGPRRIRIEWGCANELLRLRRRETRRRVVVTVVERAYNGPQTDDCRIRRKTVRLKRPLGDRVVVDGKTGRRRTPVKRL